MKDMKKAETADRMQPLYQTISEMTVNQLLGLAEETYNAFTRDIEKAQVKGFFLARAADISENALSSVKQVFHAIEKREREAEKERQRSLVISGAGDDWEVLLDRDGKGQIMDSLTNYRRIMEFDRYYDGVCFNVLRSCPEKHLPAESGKPEITLWSDADEAASLQHIEEVYGIFSEQKHGRALTMLFRDREYNPVRDLVDTLEWDGRERITGCLRRWLKCEDSAYTREVSRLIFAGGIRRLYEPGCKFDEVPILVGTRQGEGKSSFVRWLALSDVFFSEVTDFDGQHSVEQLEGAWICELSEILALTRARDQETVKAFTSRQADKYRKPYARNALILPRRCIFIGTTNNARFLTDRTGNRRFYPVEVFSDGSDLLSHEQECREYIRQCWAEAREKYRSGRLPACADKKLSEEFQNAQAVYMQDDWREGAIIRWLDGREIGTRVCARQIAREALILSSNEPPRDPTPRESREIGEIMNRMKGWTRVKNPFICGAYGPQRGWEKVSCGTDEESAL